MKGKHFIVFFWQTCCKGLLTFYFKLKNMTTSKNNSKSKASKELKDPKTSKEQKSEAAKELGSSKKKK